MYKVRGFLASLSAPAKLVIDWRMPHLPRMGETVRINDEQYATVTEVVWCLDEDTTESYQRVNVRLALIVDEQMQAVDCSKTEYCPSCNGSGEVSALAGSGPTTHEVSSPCVVCNGSGEVLATAERLAFEEWLKQICAERDGWWIRRLPDGGYSSGNADAAWLAWQARAAKTKG